MHERNPNLFPIIPHELPHQIQSLHKALQLIPKSKPLLSKSVEQQQQEAIDAWECMDGMARVQE